MQGRFKGARGISGRRTSGIWCDDHEVLAIDGKTAARLYAPSEEIFDGLSLNSVEIAHFMMQRGKKSPLSTWR